MFGQIKVEFQPISGLLEQVHANFVSFFTNFYYCDFGSEWAFFLDFFDWFTTNFGINNELFRGSLF